MDNEELFSRKSYGESTDQLNTSDLVNPPSQGHTLNIINVPELLDTASVNEASGLDKKTIILNLKIIKDSNGYGMKVSGDNPVFIESVKHGGAAQKAGLAAGDMILKVNGTDVKLSTHTQVVQLIKASPNVDLTIQRSKCAIKYKTSVSLSHTPITTNQRNSITAPQPVDHVKRKEMELYKVHTLNLMLEQERKNLETLKAVTNDSPTHRAEVLRAEQNIKKLRDQINQSCGEVNTINTNVGKTTNITPITAMSTSISSGNLGAAQSTGAFLSRFPRSLSQLNMKRKSNVDRLVNSGSNASDSSGLSSRKSFSQSFTTESPAFSPEHNNKKSSDISRQYIPDKEFLSPCEPTPPPLPHRNFSKKVATPIQDLDHDRKKPRRPSDLDYNDDVKTASHLMAHNGNTCIPPPLPPRLPQMTSVGNQVTTNHSLISPDSLNDHKIDTIGDRPLPNSIDTVLNYPLISITTSIRDNIQHNNSITSPIHYGKPSHKRIKSLTHFDTDENLKQLDERDSKSMSRDLNNETPPGSPPPPYTSTSVDHELICAAQSNIAQKPIISMEDDDASDSEIFAEESYIFDSLKSLTDNENVVFLAVFMNFVLSNSDPAPILFYLISDLYKDGNMKDMRKWAYEIHSTFLVPSAPLLLKNVDEPIAYEIDNKLQNEHDKVDVLRNLFNNGRSKAREIIFEQLKEFKIKRTAGLGTMYGPSDQNLLEAKGDKLKEQKIIEETLVPKLQAIIEDLDSSENSTKLALCSALSTVLNRFFFIKSQTAPPMEKFSHFVSREKSFKNRLMSKNRKMQMRGHNLIPHQYCEVTHCNHCQNLIWGVSPQGYHCSNCELNIHRACAKVLEENCPGPVIQKTNDNKITKLMEKIRQNPHSQHEKSKQNDDESNTTHSDRFLSNISQSSALQGSGGSMNIDNDIKENFPGNIQSGSDFDTSQTDHNFSSAIRNNSMRDFDSQYSYDTSSYAEKSSKGDNKSKSAPVSVSRSESYKERTQKRSHTNRRKTSDPSLNKNEDESRQQFAQMLHQSISGSSNSSQSSHLDSPRSSMEQTGWAIGAENVLNLETEKASSSIIQSHQLESDEELIDMDWASSVPMDILQTINDNEKKRQEIINEIYSTERSHLRNLKVLESVFRKPMMQLGPYYESLLVQLFPSSFKSLIKLHSHFEAMIKERKQQKSYFVDKIGDILMTMFTGESGERLKLGSAEFCKNQSIALENLKVRRNKDEKLREMLSKAEQNKMCRRLQLKDLVPTVLQRLTKYPLLFENLLKITEKMNFEDSSEAKNIQEALTSSRRILDHVNHAVRIAEDSHKLQTMQKKLEIKDVPAELKQYDLTQYRLVYDGTLQLKKNSNIVFHCLLFDGIMVFLQKTEEKFILKNQTIPGINNEDKILFCPVINICQCKVHVSHNAVDKTSFFLINRVEKQMVEFIAPSSSECKTWYKYIGEMADIKCQQHQPVANKKLLSLPVAINQQKQTVQEETNNELENDNQSQQENEDKSNVESSEPKEESKESPKHKNENENGLESEEHPATNNHDTENENPDEEIKDDNEKESVIVMEKDELILPSEIQVNVPTTLEAEYVLSTGERLKRLDTSIESAFLEKRKLFCDDLGISLDLLSTLNHHESKVQSVNDLIAAMYTHTQNLTLLLNQHLKVDGIHDFIDKKSLCNDCHSKLSQESHDNNGAADTSLKTSTSNDLDIIDNLYVAIESVRPPTEVPKQPENNQNDEMKTEPELSFQAEENQDPSLVSNNNNCNDNMGDDESGSVTLNCKHLDGANGPLEPMIPCNLIESSILSLNALISQLSIKHNEKNDEMENLRRENQILRTLIPLNENFSADVYAKESLNKCGKFETSDSVEELKGEQ